MKKIYDSHVHIHVDKKDAIIEYDYYDIKDLLSDQKKYGISKSVCFLNPFVPQMLCSNNHKHRIKILDYGRDKLKVYCQDCNKIIYEGKDPLRSLNIKLIEQSKAVESIIPFVYLNISKATNNEVLFFEKNYGKFVKGYKIHPKLCSRKISEIKINSDKPIIVHTGVQDVTLPSDVIKFAKNYKGNVILAHCARFSEKDLLTIKNTKNLYIDISPFMFLYEKYKENSTVLFDTSFIGKVNNPSCLLQKIVDFVGVDKILFGTDIPFSNLEKEIDFIKKCDILEENRNQIMYTNLHLMVDEEEKR